MSPRILDFENRARAALAVGEPSPAALDMVITDGCAFALTIETELRRCERLRDRLLPSAGAEADVARELVELGQATQRLGEQQQRIRAVVRELMRLRARTRLRTFAAERRMAAGG